MLIEILLIVFLVIIFFVLFKLIKRKDSSISEFTKIIVAWPAKRKKWRFSNAKKVLMVDKELQNDFLSENLFELSSFIPKPNLLVIDPFKQLFNSQANMLVRKGYQVFNVDLKNTTILLFSVLDHKINYLSNLKKNLQHIYGKYCYESEIYLTYENVMQRITEVTREIKDISTKIIQYYFAVMSKQSFEIIQNLFDSLIDELLLKKQKASERDLFLKIIKIFEEDISIWSHDLSITEIFDVQEEVLIYTKRLLMNQQNINFIDLNQLLERPSVLFMTCEDKAFVKLVLNFLNVLLVHEPENYLIINRMPYILNESLNKFKIINLVTKLTEENYEDYEVKIYRGPNNVIFQEEISKMINSIADIKKIVKLKLKRGEVIVLEGQRYVRFRPNKKHIKNKKL